MEGKNRIPLKDRPAFQFSDRAQEELGSISMEHKIVVLCSNILNGSQPLQVQV